MKLFKIRAICWLSLLLALLVPAVVTAQTRDAADIPLSGGITVEQDTANAQNPIMVGDVVTLVLRVTHPAGWRVIVPPLEATWGEMEVVDQHLPVISDYENGAETTSQRIDVRMFAPGEYRTLPLTLTIVDDQGATQPYVVAPTEVTVESILVEGDTELRDIKPQANFMIEIETNAPPFIAGLSALGFGALAVVVVLRKRAASPAVDNRTPLERAIDALDVLEALELSDLETVKAFYAGISQTVRRYLSEVLGRSLLDQTTAQMWGVLQEVNIPAETARSTAKLLKACDDVKFAPNAPDAETSTLFTNRARQIMTQINRALADVEEAAA